MKTLKIISFMLLTTLIACTSGNQSKESEESEAIEEKEEINVSLNKVWSTDTTSLITPESVLYDKNNNILYVSCINGVPPNEQDNDGYIAKVSTDGEIVEEKWVTGLSAPKGMGLHQGKLFVTDIDRVVVIDISSGNIMRTYDIDGAQFLNDITVAQSGSVYISDSNTNTIHMLMDTEGELAEWKQDTTLGGPNGLFHDGEKIMVATFGTGDFREIDVTSKEVTSVTSSIPSGDGVVKVGTDFLVSNWNGEVYYVTAGYDKKKILDTKDIGSNAADIEYIAESQLLLVPTFFGNSVVAYEVNKN